MGLCLHKLSRNMVARCSVLAVLALVSTVSEATPRSSGHSKPQARNEKGSDADADLAEVKADLRVLQGDVKAMFMEEDAFMTYVGVNEPIPDEGAVNVPGCGMKSAESAAIFNTDGELLIGIPKGKQESAQEAVSSWGDDDCFDSVDRNPWLLFKGKGAVMVDLETNSNDTAKAHTADLLNHMDRFFFDFRSPFGYTENVETWHERLFSTQIPYTVCGYVAGTDCTQRIVASREAVDEMSWQEKAVQFVFAEVKPGQSNYYKATLNKEKSIPAKTNQVSYTLKGKDLGNIGVTLCVCDIAPPSDATDEGDFQQWMEDCRKKVKWSKEDGCS